MKWKMNCIFTETLSWLILQHLSLFIFQTNKIIFLILQLTSCYLIVCAWTYQVLQWRDNKGLENWDRSNKREVQHTGNVSRGVYSATTGHHKPMNLERSNHTRSGLGFTNVCHCVWRSNVSRPTPGVTQLKSAREHQQNYTATQLKSRLR